MRDIAGRVRPGGACQKPRKDSPGQDDTAPAHLHPHVPFCEALLTSLYNSPVTTYNPYNNP